MIKAEFFFDDETITGFRLKGHAGYASSGSDIICSAVSMLTINTVNAIEEFTGIHPALHEEGTQGAMEFHIDRAEDKSQLLLKTLLLGLESVREEYGKKYISIKKSQNHKEV